MCYHGSNSRSERVSAFDNRGVVSISTAPWRYATRLATWFLASRVQARFMIVERASFFSREKIEKSPIKNEKTCL